MGMSQLNNISYGAVLSIGYNPYFHNHDKSIEVHLLSDFEHDFYDSELSLEIVHFLRPESDFKCFGILIKTKVDHLIKYINNDKWLAQLLFKWINDHTYFNNDALAEWLRRRPAKPLGFPARVRISQASIFC